MNRKVYILRVFFSLFINSKQWVRVLIASVGVTWSTSSRKRAANPSRGASQLYGKWGQLAISWHPRCLDISLHQVRSRNSGKKTCYLHQTMGCCLSRSKYEEEESTRTSISFDGGVGELAFDEETNEAIRRIVETDYTTKPTWHTTKQWFFLLLKTQRKQPPPHAASS